MSPAGWKQQFLVPFSESSEDPRLTHSAQDGDRDPGGGKARLEGGRGPWRLCGIAWGTACGDIRDEGGK